MQPLKPKELISFESNINLTGRGLTSLYGVVWPYVTCLFLSKNKIDLDTLPVMPHLTYLDLRENCLRDIDIIADKCPNLLTLVCSLNSIRAVCRLPNKLKELTLDWNGTELCVVPKSLKKLHAGCTQIKFLEGKLTVKFPKQLHEFKEVYINNAKLVGYPDIAQKVAKTRLRPFILRYRARLKAVRVLQRFFMHVLYKPNGGIFCSERYYNEKIVPLTKLN